MNFGAPNPSGGGFAGLGGADPAMMNAMMQNPGMQEMMTRIMSDPAMLDQMAAMNPQLGAMLQNPQVRAMFSNPAFVRQLMDPNTMQMAMQMQQAMGGNGMNNLFGAPPASVPSAGGWGAAGGGMNFDTLFRGTQPSFQSPAVPAVPPAERYASQLRQLADMGFADANANLRALQTTQGNVNAAVERLLGGN
jgi:ubiquilin